MHWILVIRKEMITKEDAEYLNVTEYPEATFATNSFSELSAEWNVRTVVPVSIDGTLTIKV